MRASVFAAYVCVVATRTSNRSLSCWCWWRPKPGCVSVHTIAGFAHTHTHAHAHKMRSRLTAGRRQQHDYFAYIPSVCCVRVRACMSVTSVRSVSIVYACHSVCVCVQCGSDTICRPVRNCGASPSNMSGNQSVVLSPVAGRNFGLGLGINVMRN